MSDIPTGTVTFLFTDIEGSTPLWERNPQAMRQALDRHNAILKEAIQQHGGYVFQIIGDAFCAAFSLPIQAIRSALAAQRLLAKEPWGETGPLRVRMGIHTGLAEVQGDVYLSNNTLNRVSRLMSAAHGGQVLVSAAVVELVREQLPGDVDLEDLGEHRLKGLSQPEHLYQMVVPDLPSRFPPLLTQVEALHNLPEQLAPFIGRERELQELGELLTNPEVRMVTIFGMGGSGKTSLALRFGRETVSSFPHGVWFVPLAALSSVEQIASAVAGVFNLSSFGESDPKALLLGYLETKNLLLILDNLEHLLPGAEPLLLEILQTTGEIKLLATSRQRLNLPGEWVIQLDGLECPPDNPAEDLKTYSAVKLFDESYHRIAGRPLLKSDLVSAAHICRLVDGLPLAIELAASWGRLLSAQEITQEIQNSLRFLETGQAALPERQRSLQAVFDYSWKTLRQAEKEAFQKLSVFRGGFGRQAAAQVAGASLTDLAVLSDKSLIQRPSQDHFAVHELLRQFGYERLEEAGEAQAAHDQHLDYYLSLAERAEPEIWGAGQRSWMDRLETEMDNLRAALEWSLAGPDQADLEKGLRLGGALWQFWAFRGKLNEGRKWLNRLLQAAQEQAPGAALARAYNRAGFLAAMNWDWSSAHEFFLHGLEIAQSIGNRREMAFAQSGLGQDEDSVNLFRELGDQGGLAIALNGYGSGKLNEGNYSQAGPPLEESLAIFRKMGNRLGMGNVLHDLGRLRWFQHRPGEAQPLLDESLSLHRELGNRRGIALALFNLAGVQRALGNLPKSDELSHEGLSAHQEIDYRPGVVLNLIQLGFNRLAEDRPAEALEFMEQGLAISSEIGNEDGMMLARAGLRMVYLYQNNPSLAQSLHDQNLSYYHDPGENFFMELLLLTLTDIGQLAGRQGGQDRARLFLQEALQVAQASGNPEKIAQVQAFIEESIGKGE